MASIVSLSYLLAIWTPFRAIAHYASNNLSAVPFAYFETFYLIVLLYSIFMRKAPRHWIDYARYLGFAILLILGLALDIASRNNAFLSSFNGSLLIRCFYALSFLILIFLRRPQLHWEFVGYMLLFAFGISYLPFLVSSKTYIVCSFFFALSGGVLSFFSRAALKSRESDRFLFIDCPALLALLPGLSFNSKVGYRSAFPFWLPSLIIAIVVMGVAGLAYWQRQKQKPKKSKGPLWARVTGSALIGLIVGFAYAWCGISSFNVAFDCAEPQYQIVTITDLKYVNRVRTHGYYSLSFEGLDGGCTIAVPESIYVDLQIGEKVEVAYCPGLFGEDYYIHPSYL